MKPSFRFPIEDPSQVGEARRVIVAAAEVLGFDETMRGKLALIINEAAGNLIKHAKKGQMIYRVLHSEKGPGIELLILDKGAGISDIGKSLRDGYSTAGTSGTGLGAIQRLSDHFEMFSQAGSGTAILSQVFAKPLRDPYRPGEKPASPFTIGAVTLPIKNETACGDRWHWADLPGRTLFMVVDGLGHGPKAAEAAEAAERTFNECIDQSPLQILQAAHQALHITRGAAMAICEVSLDKRQIRYAGIGNISGMICPPSQMGESRHFVSLGGTVGHETRKLQEFTYGWIPGSLLIMYSDGLISRWKLDPYPGLKARHPSLIAGVLYRDFVRGTDDVTVLIAKET